jgi:hypothetical protein
VLRTRHLILEDTMRSPNPRFLLGALLAGVLAACQSPTAPVEDPAFGISTTPRQPPPPPRPIPDLSRTVAHPQ